MNEDLRSRIGRALLSAGIVGARDSTNRRMRPQWRASFSYRGDIQGEAAYLHVFAPVDADVVQVNCSVSAPTLDSQTAEWVKTALDGFNATYFPGSPFWVSLLVELGATPDDVAGWIVETVPYVGMRHRMILTRVTLPPGDLSDSSLGLAVKLGLNLSKLARGLLSDMVQESGG